MTKKKTKKKDKKIAAFSIADKKNLKYFKMMENSLRKFHSEEELPLFLVDEAQVEATQDPHFFYRATPTVANNLMQQGYETVVKLDADQVITGDISHTWEGDFDVAVVHNSNPREAKKMPVAVWDINPMQYLNCGYVVMKDERFVHHWLRLCFSHHFPVYQMREQDLMNIMVAYMDFNVKFLDVGDDWHGLISKGYWPNIELKDDKLIMPKNDEWPQDGDKEIKIIHWAGGNQPGKMNFNLHFKKDVRKHLEYLVSDDSEKEEKKKS